MSFRPLILPARQFFINAVIWGIIGATIVLELLFLGHIGLSIRVLSPSEFIMTIGACTCICLGYKYISRDDTMRLFGHVMNQFLATGFAMTLAVSIGAYFNFPLCDTSLVAIDEKLGFDWQGYITWLDGHTLLVPILSFSYQMFTILIVVLICALFIYKESAHAQRFLMAFYLTGMATALLSCLFPAMGGYVYYNIDPHHFLHLRPAAGRVHESIMLALRSHTITSVTFPGPGIVTFPSFHSAGTLLLIYASLPLRYLRVILIPFNIVIFFSLPADGGHYLADILAGIIIAGAGILVAERTLRRSFVNNRIASC